jgi:hypothetical protein
VVSSNRRTRQRVARGRVVLRRRVVAWAELFRTVAKADENDYAKYFWGQEPGAAAWVAMWALQSALIAIPGSALLAVLQSPPDWSLVWMVPPTVLVLPIVLGAVSRGIRRRAVRRRYAEVGDLTGARAEDVSRADWSRIRRRAEKLDRRRRTRLPVVLITAGLAMILDSAGLMDMFRFPTWLGITVLAILALVLATSLLTDSWRVREQEMSVLHATVRDTAIRSHERRAGRLSGIQLGALVLDIHAAWTVDASGTVTAVESSRDEATLACSWRLWMTSLTGTSDLFVCSRNERIVDTAQRLAMT